MMDWRSVAWVVAGAITGLAAEWVAFRWVDVRGWLPDLAVGWTLMLSGLVARRHRPDSRTGSLLSLCGFSWFVGNLEGVDWPVVAWIGAHGQFLHQAILVQAILSYPTGRLDDRVDRALVVASYARSLVVRLAQVGQVTVAFGCFLVAAAARDLRGVVGPARRPRTLALAAAGLVGGASAAGALARLVLDSSAASQVVLAGYQVATGVAAVILARGMLHAPVERAAITNLVVDLTSHPAGTLRDALRRALGDPSVDVGYWVSTAGIYVDEEGRRIRLPTDGSDRTATPVDVGGRRLAVLVHDPAVLGDPGLLAAVARVARLEGVNARLQTALRAQIVVVARCERRLVTVGDEQRRHLLARLRNGTDHQLATARTALAEIRLGAEQAGLEHDSIERIAAAQRAVDRALQDVHDLARGLHPSGLDRGGLHGALRELVAQRPVVTDLSVPSVRFSPVVEAAVYFVCAEALTNIDRHAAARSASIRVMASRGSVVVAVSDDGVCGVAVRPTEDCAGWWTESTPSAGGWRWTRHPVGGLA